MPEIHSKRPILWIGSSLKDLREMPEGVKKEFGHSLREIQKGRDPGNIKPLRHVATGILEIIAMNGKGLLGPCILLNSKMQ